MAHHRHQMNTITSLNSLSSADLVARTSSPSVAEDQLTERQAFDRFVGTTFYSQMLAAMQKTVGKPAYFHGGQAEEMFRSQLNQVLAEKLAESTPDKFSGPMFELFSLNRS
jgi:peptidoglycan hydrolase FlgJ